jgi:hypothetical protein
MNFESHVLIHRQGGKVFYTHPFRWWWGPWGGQAGYPKKEKMKVSNLAVELPLDTLIGPTYDGLDILTGLEHEANEKSFRLWMELLNHGYRLAATASSDSTFDRAYGGNPGLARIYTFLDGKITLEAVARETAKGRTFVTNGPLMLVNFAGNPPGTSVPADGDEKELSLEAWKSGKDAQGLTAVELYRNGKIYDQVILSKPVEKLEKTWRISDRTSAWYCVRILGGVDQKLQAISGAFFLDVEPFQPPEPVLPRIRIQLVDQETGQPLTGILTEVDYSNEGTGIFKTHKIDKDLVVLRVPGTVRLKAEVPGYEPLTLSPIIDSPGFMDQITGLAAENLENWETFEKIRSELQSLSLTYLLRRNN